MIKDKTQPALLIKQFVFSEDKSALSNEEWELLLRQARTAGVLARLCFYWKKFNNFVPPDYVVSHLNSAEKYWLSQKRVVNWEVFKLLHAFDELNMPLILLKGTAYSAANLNVGLGRVFSDIDILVPKARLNDVVEGLKWHGWIADPLDDYDRRYYERWMHELPPMRHIKRGTSLDIHHNIIPETCSLCPNSEFLFESAKQIPNTNLWTLSQEDMILHSATHLFWGGEFESGFRDLSDLDLLLREFSENNHRIWFSLAERAKFLGLDEPLFYALRYTNKFFQTPVPSSILDDKVSNRYFDFKIRMMDALFLRALGPNHPSCRDWLTNLAVWLLYIRSHWLKMPWYLLFPHLSRKVWMSLIGKERH